MIYFRLTSSQMTRAVMYILPCVLIATFLNIGKFFEAETVSYCMDFTSCGCGYHEVTYVRPTQLRLSRNYIIFYSTWTWVTMTSLGPFFILTLLNVIIWRKLKQAKKTMAKLNKTIHHPKVSFENVRYIIIILLFTADPTAGSQGEEDLPLQHIYPTLYSLHVSYV